MQPPAWQSSAGAGQRIADPEDEGRVVAAEASTLSDSTGRFELPAPRGYWRLRVEAEGTRPFEEDHLRSGDFRWVRLEWAADLLVYVVSGSHVPLPGARVELVADEYAPTHLAIARAATDAGGRATVAVPSGRWTLAVRHPEHRPHFEPLDLQAGSRRHERTVRLSAGMRVFGQVSVRGIAAPPSGTRVAIDSMLMFRESVVVACDADGRFDTGRVFSADQVLDVAALAPGFGETRKELDLGGRPEDGEVEVHLSLEHRDRAAHGRVVDAHGAPIERASVFVKPLLALAAEAETPLSEDLERLREVDVARGPKESYQAQWRRVTGTDARGEFRVDGLDHRRPYSLLVVSPHYANARAWIEATESADELDLGTIVLPAGGRIYGVVQARDGSSVKGLQVSTIRLERPSTPPAG